MSQFSHEGGVFRTGTGILDGFESHSLTRLVVTTPEVEVGGGCRSREDIRPLIYYIYIIYILTYILFISPRLSP